MPSSTSSSDQTQPESSVFRLAVGVLAVLCLSVTLCANIIGRAYHPSPLNIQSNQFDKFPNILVIFGNSRIEAAFDLRRLEQELGVSAHLFCGGGWHPMHYYQLALLNAASLRPGRDSVVMDVSLLSFQGGSPPERLGVIRSETALPIASLQGLPAESRLDILFGSTNNVYRYRLQIQEQQLEPRLTKAAKTTGDFLEKLGLEGPAPTTPKYRFITEPNRNFVMKEIQGDLAAFKASAHESLKKRLTNFQIAPYHKDAAERSVEELRSRKIDVVLVSVPLGRWATDRLSMEESWHKHQAWLDDLAQRTGARLIHEWPEDLLDEKNFYDGHHLFSHATERVSREFARQAKAMIPHGKP